MNGSRHFCLTYSRFTHKEKRKDKMFSNLIEYPKSVYNIAEFLFEFLMPV